MIPFCLEGAEEDLRFAVQRSHACDLHGAISRYVWLAGQELANTAPDGIAPTALYERVLGVLDWTDSMLRTQRSALVEELRALRNADRFLASNPDSPPQFSVDV